MPGSSNPSKRPNNRNEAEEGRPSAPGPQGCPEHRPEKTHHVRSFSLVRQGLHGCKAPWRPSGLVCGPGKGGPDNSKPLLATLPPADTTGGEGASA